MQGTFTFLGTGASAGVPVIGCNCGVCLSGVDGNKRSRSSGLLEIGAKKLLIDAGPDFRLQALRENINHLDGLLLTHTHFDHIAGIDELRVYWVRQNQPIPCLLSAESREIMRRRYDYLEKHFAYQVIPDSYGSVSFLGVPIDTLRYYQGDMEVTGYRIFEFAYISDIRRYEESIFQQLQGVRILALSALRFEESHVHLSVEEAVAFARRVGAETTYLIHTSHGIDCEAANRALPKDIRMGYDGLKISFGY